MSSSSAPGEALLVLDPQLNVRAANKAFYGMFRLAPAECVGRKVYELGERAWDEKLRTMLEAVLKGEPQSDHFELIHDEKEGGRGVLWLSARLVPSAHPADAKKYAVAALSSPSRGLAAEALQRVKELYKEDPEDQTRIRPSWIRPNLE